MVPEGWMKAELGTLGRCIRGVSYEPLADLRAADGPDTIRLLRAGNIQDWGVVHDDLQFVSAARCQNSQVLQDGDLAICMSSGSKALVGKAAPYWQTNGLRYVVGAFCAAFRPHEEAVPAFVRCLFDTESFRRWMHILLAGSSINNLRPGDIESLTFAVPKSIKERRGIARVVESWDRSIRSICGLIDRKERVLSELRQKLLTGKQRLPGYAGRWRSHRIGSLLKNVVRHIVLKDDVEYRLVSIRRRSGGLFDREPRQGRDIGYAKLKTIRGGDFVIARRQVVHGAMAMARREFDGAYVSDAYATLVARPEAGLHMPFFDYLSQTPLMYYKAYRCSYGVAIEKLFFDLDWFLREEVSIPPTVEEQERIAAVLSAADREIDLLRRELDLLRKQKRGLMQKLLTGQIRVKS